MAPRKDSPAPSTDWPDPDLAARALPPDLVAALAGADPKPDAGD